MRWSHSKLSCILNCPMTYYLNYKEGIELKEEKKALAIGSAVHWGIEHDTEDLTEYYNEKGTFDQVNNYTDDQLLCESMVHGYLKHKDEIFKEILKDFDSDEQLELIDEKHEIEIFADLPSHYYATPHEFHGIIDLLLLTNKGFIIVDYKTSGKIPDWDKYLDQIYRYIFLIRHEFPDVPVYKIGIVNLRKSQIRMGKNENNDSFRLRLKKEYDINEELINTHMYEVSKLDPELIENYIDNLSYACDEAQRIDEDEKFFINFGNAIGEYGKSKYWDIFYNTKDCYLLYKIRDTIFDEDDGVLEWRDCLPLDMLTVRKHNVMNHFDKFKSTVNNILIDSSEIPSKDTIFSKIKDKYITDDSLLNKYWDTFLHVNEQEIS